MSFWTKVRDTVENATLGAADYVTGGAASVLGGLRSKSAQNSTLGHVVDIGGKIYGTYNLANAAYNAANAGNWGTAISKGAGALTTGAGAAAQAMGAPQAQYQGGGLNGVGTPGMAGNSTLSNLINAGIAYAGANSVAPPPGPYGGSYTPPNLSGIANTTTNAINSLQNPLGAYTGQINNQLQTGVPQLQQIGQNAIGQIPGITSAYQNAGNYANAGANFAANNAQGLATAGQQVWNTALDPQQALYNRTLNQITQQDNAQQAARGLTMSPVGQELSNQATSNFNIDWQNQQLQRQLSGLQGLGSAYGNATNMGIAGSNLMNSAANNAGLAASAPLQIGSAATQAPLGLLNSAYPLLNSGNVANAAQAGLGMQYMGVGQSGAGLGLNAALAQAPYAANGLNSLGQLGSQAVNGGANGIANALQGIGNSGASTYYDPNANYYSNPYSWNSPSSTSGFGNNAPYSWNAPTSTSLGSSFSDQLNGSYIPSTPAGLNPVNTYFGGNSGYSNFGSY